MDCLIIALVVAAYLVGVAHASAVWTVVGYRLRRRLLDLRRTVHRLRATAKALGRPWGELDAIIAAGDGDTVVTRESKAA
jgi:hypothetical protein